MGTSLTGLTPATTYDALIKVGDNAPLDGTLKTLSDGLGNDSALALSTAGVGIGTTSSSLFGTTGFGRVLGVVASSNYAVVQVGGAAASGGEIDLGAGSIRQGAVASLDGSSLAFYTNPTNAGNGLTERMRITSAGKVGIGTSAPTTKLQVAGDNGNAIAYLYNNSGAAGQVNGVSVEAGTNSSDYALSVASSLGTSYLRVRGDGNVGIGTSAPTQKLEVSGAFSSVATAIISVVDTAQIFRGTPDGVAFEHAKVLSGRDDSLLTYGSFLAFFTEAKSSGTTDTSTEKVRIDSKGFLRMAAATGGIQFNGDTAAANALDDYEEGTWTPSLGGTWSTNPTSLAGLYTKIGNMVYIRLDFTGGVKASNTSGWFDGLPFSGAVGGGGTVSNVSVEDKGIVLLDNSTRVWTTNNDFGGLGTKVMASYRV